MTTRQPLIALIGLVLILAAAPIAAGDPVDPELVASKTTDSQPDPVDPTARVLSLIDLPPEKVERLTPLQAQMRQILLAELVSLVPLQAAFAEETDSLRSLEIQRRIQAVKVATEISLLRAQADHARLNGRPEVAERIEEGLRRMAERDRARQDNSQDPRARPAEPGARR